MKSTNKKPKLHIKRGDIVIAITGEDAVSKKAGKVLQVFPDRGRALVEGFHYVKKHMRKTQDNPQGGIIEKEASIAVSNLKLQTPASEASKTSHKKAGE